MKRGTSTFLVVLLVLFAMLTLALRFALSRVGDYEEQILSRLSSIIDSEVQVETIAMTLRGIKPIAKLSGIHIASPNDTIEGMYVQQMRIDFDPFLSLFNRRVEISSLHISGTDFSIVTDADGNSRVFGFLPINSMSGEEPMETPSNFDLYVERANIHWRNEQMGVEHDFENVSALFKSSAGRLKFAARAFLPSQLGQFVHIAADLTDSNSRTATNDPSGDGTQWSGRIYMRAENAHLAQWSRLAGRPDAARGSLSAELWSNWRGGVLRRLDSTFDCQACAAADVFESSEPVSFKTRLSWETHEDGWRLGLLDFGWATSQFDIENSDAAFVYDEDESRLAVRAPALDEGLLHLAAAKQFRENEVEIFDGHGALSVSAAIAHSQPHRRFEPPKSPPGIPGARAPTDVRDWQHLLESNLRFAVDYATAYAEHLRSFSEIKTARVDADLKDMSVRVPGWSDLTFDLNEAAASVRYTNGEPAAMVDIDKLFVRLGGVRVGGRIAWMGGAKPTADVALTIKDLPLTSVPELLPREGLKPRLSAWLHQAFDAGILKSARVELNGGLSSFPFRDGGGWFYAEGEVEDAVLNYRKNRQALHDVNGRIVFDDQRMLVEASGLRHYGLESRSMRAVIEDIALPFIEVDATGAGAFAGVLEYLKDERLINPDSLIMRSLEPGGDSRLRVSVKAPLSKKVEKPVTVNGTLDFDETSLRIVPLDLEFSDIAGKMDFDRSGGRAKLLTAKLNGFPVTAAAQPLKGGTSLAVEGDVPVSQLFDLSVTPLRDAVDGISPWRADILIPNLRAGAEHELKITLTSSLEGITVELPAPFGKDATQQRDFSADIVLGKSKEYTLSYGDEVAMILIKDAPAKPLWGRLHFGDTPPPAFKRDAFTISGEISEAIEIDDWSKLAGKRSGFGSYLDNFKVSLAEVRQGGELLGEAAVVLKPREGGREMEIDAPWAKGWIFMPAADDGIVFAKMEKLILPKPSESPSDDSEKRREGIDRIHETPPGEDTSHPRQRRGSSQTTREATLNPANVPAFELEVADFRRGELRVSDLHLVTEPIKNGMRIGRLTFEAGEVSASMSGRWLFDGKRHRSHFDLDVSGRDFGKMLRMLDISSSLKDGEGTLVGHVAWDDRPAGFAPEKLEGEVRIDLKDGVIEKANPGISRLLGLFSVGHIVRRLSLDFRDIIERGLAFDTLEGEIIFRDSVMRTENFFVTGPALAMAVSGDTNIAKERYDQWIDVVPNLSSGLPVAGALLAGPIAGAAVYLLDKLTKFGSKMDKAISLRYHLHGDWDNPKIDFEGTPEVEKDTKGGGNLLEKAPK